MRRRERGRGCIVHREYLPKATATQSNADKKLKDDLFTTKLTLYVLGGISP